MNEEVLICIANHLPIMDAMNISLAFPHYGRLASYVMVRANVTIQSLGTTSICRICDRACPVSGLSCDFCHVRFCYHHHHHRNICRCLDFYPGQLHCKDCVKNMAIFDNNPYNGKRGPRMGPFARAFSGYKCRFGNLNDLYRQWQLASKN